VLVHACFSATSALALALALALTLALRTRVSCREKDQFRTWDHLYLRKVDVQLVREDGHGLGARKSTGGPQPASCELRQLHGLLGLLGLLGLDSCEF